MRIFSTDEAFERGKGPRNTGEFIVVLSDRLIAGMENTVEDVIEDLDSARDRAVVTREELVNRLSEQLNMRMYVLSLVAAVFLPLGLLTGSLGINLAGVCLHFVTMGIAIALRQSLRGRKLPI